MCVTDLFFGLYLGEVNIERIQRIAEPEKQIWLIHKS